MEQAQLPPRGFWNNLYNNKIRQGETITVLAPMADVTDCAFRELIAKYSRMGQAGGGPDVMWTEFVSANGLCSPGKEILARDLVFQNSERPIVAQLFTSNPENMERAASLCRELGFDGIDINMGCPDKGIEKQGAGAAHIKNPDLAKEVIKAAQRGAGNLPVTVKTRLGFNKIEYEKWLPAILECKVPAITIHLRTRKEMSLVPAHWELMPQIVEFIKKHSRSFEEGGPLIIGNGDVTSVGDGRSLAQKTGCHGVMVGRGIFGTPWFFDESASALEKTVRERLEICIEHTQLFEKVLGDIKSFAIMKKHYKAYVNGFDGAKELRMRMMDATNAKEVKECVEEFLRENPNF